MNYKRSFITIAAFLSFLILTDTIAHAQKILRIRGSSTLHPVATIAARIYGKNHNIRIIVEGGGSTKGIEGAGQGAVDVGTASRNIYPEEKKKYRDLIVHTIGYEGIAIILNKENPVDNLSSKQIIDIYTGKIRNWKELGGSDRPIKLISKESGSSTLDLFLEHFKMEVTKKENLMYYKIKGDKEYSETGARIIGQDSEVIGAVSAEPGTIGYVSIVTAEKAARKLKKIKRIKLDGVEASKENVKNKIYPLMRPLNLITKGRPAGDIKEFIELLLSDKGQNIVKNLDYIPVRQEM